MAEEEVVYTNDELDHAQNTIVDALNKADIPRDLLHAVAMCLAGCRTLQELGLKDSDTVLLLEGIILKKTVSGPN